MKDSPVLAFPQQNSLTGALRQRSAQIGNPEYQSLWAGTGYRYCRAESVKDLVDRLEAGYHAAEKRDR
jgi:nitronate monooxygenase